MSVVPAAGPAAVLVEVIDRGAGVPPEVRADLFRPFGARRRADDGTVHGLGLAIAAAAVQAQGGAIGFEDAPGGGARFWFTVPSSPAGAPRS